MYSANVQEPFGRIAESNLDDFTKPSILFGIDGDFQLEVKLPGEPFATTDHCGRIEILSPQLDVAYCRAAMALARAYGFDRTPRPSLTRVSKLTFEFPVLRNAMFDVGAQKELASRYDAVVGALAEAKQGFGKLTDLQPDVMLPHTDT